MTKTKSLSTFSVTDVCLKDVSHFLGGFARVVTGALVNLGMG